jgi:predicted transcriptional regulator
MHILKNINKILIYNDQKISDAIAKINSSNIKILFVVNKKKKLLGSVSSGDLRRSISQKLNHNSSVEDIMSKKVKYFYEKN